ncbi:MAG: single-stranded-DNA-specific exonuclease RecJ [Litorivicinus sp.]
MTSTPRPLATQVFDAALSHGATLLQARILAGRLSDQQAPSVGAALKPSLAALAPPLRLKGMACAVERLVGAIQGGERIGLITDYDVDGITSHWVLLHALRDHFKVPAERISSWIGHRIHDGYGISQTLVDRLLASPEPPAVVVTADCGSSDEPRIAQLAAAGIDVIVGDHHAIPADGVPASALAVINPTQSDCDYPDASIAGVMVSWLIMSGLRQGLIDSGYLAASAPKLVDALDAVALGTVADCVDLGGSAINRAVVRAGLSQINRLERPVWQAFAELIGPDNCPIDAETLAFQMGPRINARGRIDDPMQALYLMLAGDRDEAHRHLDQLSKDNESRKTLERTMVDACMPKAIRQRETGRFSVVVSDDKGHPGVQGIVASRLTERTGLPSVVLAPAQLPAHYVGSMRSVPGVNAKQALQACSQWLTRFGGHHGAAGLTLPIVHLTEFAMALDAAVREQVQEQPRPVRWHDGDCDPADLSNELIAELDALQPYGRGFESPVFVGQFHIDALRPVGKDPVHLSLNVRCGQQSFRTVWFRALKRAGEQPPVEQGGSYKLMWRPVREKFRGDVRLVPRIEGLAD